jgi:hypothetical protein
MKRDLDAEHDRVHITFELDTAQAYALAELCKRLGWTDVRSNAVGDAEARYMIAATEHLRIALAHAGVRVR